MVPPHFPARIMFNHHATSNHGGASIMSVETSTTRAANTMEIRTTAYTITIIGMGLKIITMGMGNRLITMMPIEVKAVPESVVESATVIAAIIRMMINPLLAPKLLRNHSDLSHLRLMQNLTGRRRDLLPRPSVVQF
ncbi:hypothetical protein MPER_03777 [Moniliophthora perniciosa FA553]|nr:hypothetical protein MPER_03777 [Moniliophthora perniciosa FA553]